MLLQTLTVLVLQMVDMVEAMVRGALIVEVTPF